MKAAYAGSRLRGLCFAGACNMIVVYLILGSISLISLGVIYNYDAIDDAIAGAIRRYRS